MDDELRRVDAGAAPGLPYVRMYGVYSALVIDIEDPFAMGRVRVKMAAAPEEGGDTLYAWARLATLAAGRDSGTWFLPDINDEVLVAFDGGDPSRPFVIGALWNGEDNPPVSAMGDSNDIKMLRTRSGIEIMFGDDDGDERLSLSTPAGQKIVLKDQTSSISIMDANGNAITMSGGGLVIHSQSELRIEGSSVSVAAGQIRFDTPSAVFSGLAKAVTVECTSVISQNYTPGAGNVW